MKESFAASENAILLGDHAFLGGALSGSSRVRFVFMDESGITAQQPITLVVGAIVHGDRQWLSVAEHIAALLDEYVPEPIRPNFVTHAVDLFSGKAFKPHAPRERSLELLKKLVLIPNKFSVPLSVGYIRKLDTPNLTPKERTHRQHIWAFLFSLGAANKFIRDMCPGELGSIVLEKNDEMSKELAKAPDALRNPAMAFHQMPSMQALLPYDRIVSSVLEARKESEPLLQIADACAWSIRRALASEKGGDELVPFLPRIYLKELQASGGGYFTILPNTDASVAFSSDFLLTLSASWTQALR